jgi:mRNA-processing protein COX24
LAGGHRQDIGLPGPAPNRSVPSRQFKASLDEPEPVAKSPTWRQSPWSARVPSDMGSLIKKRRKRMRKKKHKKMLKATRWQRRAAGK